MSQAPDKALAVSIRDLPIDLPEDIVQIVCEVEELEQEFQQIRYDLDVNGYVTQECKDKITPILTTILESVTRLAGNLKQVTTCHTSDLKSRLDILSYHTKAKLNMNGRYIPNAEFLKSIDSDGRLHIRLTIANLSKDFSNAANFMETFLEKRTLNAFEQKVLFEIFDYITTLLRDVTFDTNPNSEEQRDLSRIKIRYLSLTIKMQLYRSRTYSSIKIESK